MLDFETSKADRAEFLRTVLTVERVNYGVLHYFRIGQDKCTTAHSQREPLPSRQIPQPFTLIMMQHTEAFDHLTQATTNLLIVPYQT